MDEASKIARKEPSFKTTMPSRTSAIGTKSCVEREDFADDAAPMVLLIAIQYIVAHFLRAFMTIDQLLTTGFHLSAHRHHGKHGLGVVATFFVRLHPRRNTLFDIERPCELMKFTVGEFWHVNLRPFSVGV